MDWSIPVDVLMIELDGSNRTKDALCRRLLASKGMQWVGRMGVQNANDVWLGSQAKYVNTYRLLHRKGGSRDFGVWSDPP